MGEQVIGILIFGVLALVLLYRLWLVLGRRTGNERPRPAVPVMRQAEAARENVVPLRPRVTAPPPIPGAPEPPAVGLDRIKAADPSFRAEQFVDGARYAFEMIVKAFADGDTATLRPLVSDEVYDAFADVIRQRLAVRESTDTKIVRLAEPEIAEAHMDGRTAVVTVKFVSSQISVTRAADGRLIEGDPEQPAERIDFWTFARNTRSPDPNWILVGTGEPE